MYVSYYAKRLGPRVRQRVIAALEDRFDADVELRTLDLEVFPQPSATGKGLTIRHRGWADAKPLISINKFTAKTDYDTLVDRRNRITVLKLEGLQISLPPRGRSSEISGEEEQHPVESAQPGTDRTEFKFLIEEMIADRTTFEIQTKVPGKDPLEFELEKLTLHSVGSGRAMTFKARLTNPKPPGWIDTTGTFGPWQRDDPRATAVSGNYRFQKADLAVFKGISGILSSTGQYRGVLQHIVVDGSADVPKFALKRGGMPVNLNTRFHSVVNGTDGDTILEPVDARFLHSEFICSGSVANEPGRHGKTVSLDAHTVNARMEDILTLIVGDSRPFVKGHVTFQSNIVIPSGHEDVINKLQLNGSFALNNAEFTSEKVVRRLQTLSQRARGIDEKEAENLPRQMVASDFKGRFRLAKGTVSFSSLSFSLPGAAILLKGTYDLRNQRMDMNGKFRMQSTLSDTQAGIKHWILKPLDPIFEKDGAGFEVPLMVKGTKDHPEITADVFHHGFTIH